MTEFEFCKRCGKPTRLRLYSPQVISEELSNFLGEKVGVKVSRAASTKFIAEYIKSNKLNNPENMTIIEVNRDEKLEALLRYDQYCADVAAGKVTKKVPGDGKCVSVVQTDTTVYYYTIQKLIQHHFLKFGGLVSEDGICTCPLPSPSDEEGSEEASYEEENEPTPTRRTRRVVLKRVKRLRTVPQPCPIPPSAIRSAYIQGDWSAAAVTPGEVDAKEEYRAKLRLLADEGIKNTATWHDEAIGVEESVKEKDSDVLRNCSQVDKADCVITLATRLDPPYKHWGSLATMAYAVGKGKRCFIVCSDDNVLLKSYFVWHPLITRFSALDELLHFLSSTQ